MVGVGWRWGQNDNSHNISRAYFSLWARTAQAIVVVNSRRDSTASTAATIIMMKKLERKGAAERDNRRVLLDW